MKSARYVMAFITLLLLGIAIWMKISEFTISGIEGGKYGRVSTLTSGAVFFMAAVMGVIWWAIVWTQNKDRRSP